MGGLLEGDWKILIKRMIDDKTPVRSKKKIYSRLMEPDIDVDVKNLIVTIRYTAADQQLTLYEDFIVQKEQEKIEEERKKKQAEGDKIKAEEKKKRDKERAKEMKIREKEKRLERKKLIEKIREERRIRDSQKTQGERDIDEERRREREKVREEIRRARENRGKIPDKLKPSMQDDSDSEDELAKGWTIYRYQLKKVEVQQCKVAVTDLAQNNNTITQEELAILQAEIDKAKKQLGLLGEKIKDRRGSKEVEGKNAGKDDKKEEQGKSEEKVDGVEKEETADQREEKKEDKNKEDVKKEDVKKEDEKKEDKVEISKKEEKNENEDGKDPKVSQATEVTEKK